MLLGALVDLGISADRLREALGRLPLGGYRIEAHEARRAGLRATKVDVIVEGESAGAPPKVHDHGRGTHAHSHAHEPVPARGRGASGPHVHRGLADVLELLQKGGLEAPVRDRAGQLFRRLAEAEAAVHGTGVEEVHFHEVGAVDSIVDIVGAVWGLQQLGAERFVSSPLNLGSGTVSVEHGVLPVPAPATARLTMGVPVYGEGQGELTTPTGALLVTSHATSYGPLPRLTMDRVGCGAGSREVDGRANVLRLIVGDALEPARAGERVIVLETEIDDMSPQFYGPLVEKLLGAGALDAYLTPIVMKKGRPGVLVTALAPPEGSAAVETLLFQETTTLGVRRWECERTCLDRDFVTVETAYGAIRIKRALREGRTLNAQPEFEDCECAAGAKGVPTKEVWVAALAAFRQAYGQPKRREG
jgi:uncharacterized protein (TIGR00299 family) protein